MREIDIRATASAPAEAVWALLDDSASWPAWTPIDTHERERPAGPDGLGEIRVFRTGRVRVREQIVERRPGHHFGYVLLSGLAVRDYRADIELLPAPGGTAIRWHTTFPPKLPGTGWIYHRALEKATRQFVDGLVGHAR